MQNEASFTDLDWFFSTKEELNPTELIKGLLDFGLFSEKVPPCFTTEGLMTALADDRATLFAQIDAINDNSDKEALSKAREALKTTLNKSSHDFIRYSSLRDVNIPRHMGIPHPEAYAAQCFGIEKNWQQIAEHCNKPNPTISRIHVRRLKGGRVFEMNYKGTDRDELEETQIGWKAGARYVVKADIANCFPSIYTHSIPWALHGKDKAKTNRSLSLTGNLLDKLCQGTRDGQTNGLLIGPHASNIISEIVLTAIDVTLQNKGHKNKGHKKLLRHIDDYTFYAKSYGEAELFIKELGVLLRAYEMSLNEKKTQILALPRPSGDDWVLKLNRFVFPAIETEIKFGLIKSYLDLALECVQSTGKSTPLNYAIKVLACSNSQDNEDESADKKKQARRLEERAKRLYVQEAINLALAYPYLAPLLDECVFDIYRFTGFEAKIAEFCEQLLLIGVKKLYPDTIAYAIYYALKYKIAFQNNDDDLLEAVKLDDCLTNVLLWSYAKEYKKNAVISSINGVAEQLKRADKREQDKQWLLIYQLWSAEELEKKGQSFLASLKTKNFKFLNLPTP